MKSSLGTILFAIVILHPAVDLRAVEICIVKPNGLRLCIKDQPSVSSQDLMPKGDSSRYEHRVREVAYTPSRQADFFSPGSMGSNGPALTGAVVNAAASVADAFDSFARADQERHFRYAYQDRPGQTYEQKAQAYAAYQTQVYTKLEQENLLRNLEWGKSDFYENTVKQRDEFNRAVNQAASFAQTIHESDADMRQPESDSRQLDLNVTGLSDTQIAYLFSASDKVVESSRNSAASDIIAERWATRIEKIHNYWTNENVRTACSKVRLSARAQGTFFLPSMNSDSFETYEIISVANQLSREVSVVNEPINRMLVSLMLNQAYGYALEGETFSSTMMVENALNVRDFSRGLTTGLFENIYDTASGFWHLVRHPLDSLSAIASAIINYDQTFDIIVNKLKDVINDFPSYSPEEKGRFLGYVATEIAITIGTGGTNWVADAAKTARFTEGVAIAVERTAQVLKTPGLNKFEASIAALSHIGRQNVEFLRDYAQKQGYILKNNLLGKPEEWGVFVGGKWEWRVKIKPEAGMREGLEAGSRVPRASVRLDAHGNYINPFTGEVGRKSVGGHIPLEQDWFVK